MAQKLLIQLKKSKHMNWMKLICNDILEQAEESTRRYQSSKPLSQLDGVFVTVKEELYVKGLEAKAGTHFVNDGTPAVEDAAMVLKLRNAGAIIIGSTVMSELGWDTFSINPYTITPKNPHALSHSCGGSCGGSGGSVGGGLAPISVGSDGGGSLRVPAAFCGAYGLKATYARISGHAGSSLDPSVGAYGSLSGTADDMALTYSITAGPDLKDPNTLLQPAVNLKDYDRYLDLSDLTIATTPEWNKSVVEPAILEQLNVFKAQLEKLGARFVEIDIPDLDISSTGNLKSIRAFLYVIINFYNSSSNYNLQRVAQFQYPSHEEASFVCSSISYHGRGGQPNHRFGLCPCSTSPYSYDEPYAWFL